MCGKKNGTGHLWYVRDGQVDFSRNGAYIYPDHVIPAEKYCWLVGGQIDQTCSGVYYLNLDGTEGWYGFRRTTDYLYFASKSGDGSWMVRGGNGQVIFPIQDCSGKGHSYHLANVRGMSKWS